jgi:WD40 repeat protein
MYHFFPIYCGRRLLTGLVAALIGSLVFGESDHRAIGQEPIRILQGHDFGIYALAITRDSKVLVSGDKDCTVILWDLIGGKKLKTLKTGAKVSTAGAMDLSADGKLLATAGLNGSIDLWEVESGKTVRRLDGHEGDPTSLAFARDGKILVSAGWNSQNQGEITVWDVQTGKVVKKLTWPNKGIRTLVMSADGKFFASSGDDTKDRGEIRLWEAETGKELATWARVVARSLAFSPDGTLLAGGDVERGIRLWDLKTYKEKAKIEAHEGGADCVCFSPDSRHLVSSSDRDGSLKIWTVDTLQHIWTIRRMGDEIGLTLFSPDGKTLIANTSNSENPSDNAILLWDWQKLSGTFKK